MADPKTISSSALNKWLQDGQDVSIPDIRPVKKRVEWFIPQSIYFKAYQLKANAESQFRRFFLNKDIPVIAVRFLNPDL